MSDGQLSVLPVNFESLDMVWGLITPDLERSLGLDLQGWSPELVLNVLRRGEAFLHVMYDGEDYLGFTMTILEQKPLGMEAFIWIAGGKGLTRTFGAYEEEMERVGIVAVTWGSPRKGFERMKHGYKKVATLYRKELNHAVA